MNFNVTFEETQSDFAAEFEDVQSDFATAFADAIAVVNVPTKVSAFENDVPYAKLSEVLTSYEALDYKPQIEGVVLSGNKTFSELNLIEEDNASILEQFKTVFGS